MLRYFALMCLLSTKVFSEEIDLSNKRKKFEYKYSFKGPHLMQSDGTVPFWKLNGVAAAGEDQIRLVPSIKGMKGSIWSLEPFNHDSWEVIIRFNVRGRTRMGADGMAFWYTQGPLEVGPALGSQSVFTGLGLFLDSFDNDGKKDNPHLGIFVNDGTQAYNHDSDGFGQLLGGCPFNYRNNAYSTRIKITYHANTLQVEKSPGYKDDYRFEPCTVVQNVHLPAGNYFGVSAATGGVADDHDILQFLTWSIADKVDESVQLSPEEQAQQEEYEKNVEEFNKMHEEFKEAHPDNEDNEAYQDISGPELQAIFDVQSQIQLDISVIHDMMVSLQQQQTQATNLIQNMDTTRPSTPQQPATGADDNAKSYHIDNVMNLQRELKDSVNNIKSALQGIQQSVASVSQQVNRNNAQAQQGGGNTGDAYAMQQVQQQLVAMQGELHQISNKQQPRLQCPEPEMPSCTSVAVVVAIAIIQLLVLIIYHQIKSSREDAAKKFF